MLHALYKCSIRKSMPICESEKKYAKWKIIFKVGPKQWVRYTTKACFYPNIFSWQRLCGLIPICVLSLSQKFMENNE